MVRSLLCTLDNSFFLVLHWFIITHKLIHSVHITYISFSAHFQKAVDQLALLVLISFHFIVSNINCSIALILFTSSSCLRLLPRPLSLYFSIILIIHNYTKHILFFLLHFYFVISLSIQFLHFYHSINSSDFHTFPFCLFTKQWSSTFKQH